MEITLTAEARTGTGTGVARKLRAAGRVPGVIYGTGGEPTSVSLDRRELTHALATSGLNVLISLNVGDDKYLTLARELQKDPIRGDILHVDLLRVDRNQPIEAEVPLSIVGDARGLREGGMLEHHVWTVRVSAIPAKVPATVEADISDLGLHDHLRVSQLPLPEGVTMLSDPDEIVATIITPQDLKVEAELDQPDVTSEEAAAAAEAASGEGSTES